MMQNKLFVPVVLAMLVSSALVPAAYAADRPHLSYVHAPVAKPHTRLTKEALKDVKFEAPRQGEITVSDHDFNRFVFSSPIVQLVFPGNAPVLGQPVYLAGNTQVLVQLQSGTDKAVQMVVELDGGHVETLRLLPRPIAGIVYGKGANDSKAAVSGPVTAADQAAGTPRGEDIELLKRVVQNDIPSGFDSIALPRPTRFDKFTVVPLAGWSDGGSRRVMAFSLVAVPGQTAVVAPPQFYRPGITAVLVDGDVVDAKNSPNLYVVEETHDE